MKWDFENENVVSPLYERTGLFRQFYHKPMTYLVSLERQEANLTDSERILTIEVDLGPRWLLKNENFVDFHTSAIRRFY